MNSKTKQQAKPCRTREEILAWIEERRKAADASSDECIETEFGHMLIGDAEPDAKQKEEK